jgi:hypothetical protein
VNTTAAALQANVTTATIRTWCRIGAVAAVKLAGRWIIEARSLAKRIAMTAKPKGFTVETMTAIGGSRWTKNGMDRVYINSWAGLAGIETSNYNTGNIAAAWFQGEEISNSQAYKMLSSIDKVWFDTADGKLHCRYGFGESRVASREELWAAVVAGIRAAIAAL